MLNATARFVVSIVATLVFGACGSDAMLQVAQQADDLQQISVRVAPEDTITQRAIKLAVAMDDQAAVEALRLLERLDVTTQMDYQRHRLITTRVQDSKLAALVERLNGNTQAFGFGQLTVVIPYMRMAKGAALSSEESISVPVEALRIVCAPEWCSGKIFNSQDETQRHLLASGYHEVPWPFNKGSSGLDYSIRRNTCDRDEAVICGASCVRKGCSVGSGKWSYKIEGPEPDPELTWCSLLGPSWLAYVAAYHEAC